LPYGVGHLQGQVAGAEAHLYRSGLLDSVYRLSVNLKGGPAMPVEDFRKWRQKMLIGVSLRIVAPTGQCDSTKLVNWGNNRWGFKPEIGYSQRWGHWVVDAYGAAWFYTTNPEFFSNNQYFPGTRTQSENPVAVVQGHLSELERGSKSADSSAETPDWGDSDSNHKTSVSQGQLQQWRVHQLWRKFSGRFRRMAIFLDWLAEIKIRGKL
jgi:hypothetical protein